MRLPIGSSWRPSSPPLFGQLSVVGCHCAFDLGQRLGDRRRGDVSGARELAAVEEAAPLRLFGDVLGVQVRFDQVLADAVSPGMDTGNLVLGDECIAVLIEVARPPDCADELTFRPPPFGDLPRGLSIPGQGLLRVLGYPYAELIRHA